MLFHSFLMSDLFSPRPQDQPRHPSSSYIDEFGRRTASMESLPFEAYSEDVKEAINEVRENSDDDSADDVSY
jgi:hypothetical protein